MNNGEFVSVATTLVQQGLDPVINSITQLIGRTVFANRPYDRKFKGLERDSQTWGAVTRKISFADKPFEDNDAYNLVEGEPIDMFKINKPNVLQVNFYGRDTWAKTWTTFREQLRSAFLGPDQWGEFLASQTQNVRDMVEQAMENMTRNTINNFILGKKAADNGIIHLLTEYNAEIGTQPGEEITKAIVFAPENFPNFIRWMYSRVSALTKLMTERSSKYQINVTGKTVMRHTPLDRQKVYMMTSLLEAINARVLSDAYHDDFLKYADVEAVNYWQAIDNPGEIQGRPTYLNASGELETASEDVTASDVVGIIFDEDAMGYTIFDEEAATSPYNSRGHYWNSNYSFEHRYYNDFTEKGIILELN